MSNLLKNWLKKRPHEPEESSAISNKKTVPDHHTHHPNTNGTSKVNENSDIVKHIPACWNISQYETFKENNDWLIVENKALGCSLCRKVDSFAVYSDKNHRVSKAWQECSVTQNGKTRESQQSSLRKKIFEHKRSEAHNKAIEILEQSKKKTIEGGIEKMNEALFTTTERVFRTVYKIAKNQRPFTDLPVDIDLQVSNGLPMGNILHSDKTCHDIATHIAFEMKSTICKNIIENKKKISILIDESTTLSKKSTLVVVIRTYFEDASSDLLDTYVFNLDLIELTNTNAENITNDLLTCLNKYGFDQAFLEECLIAFACDGASVMIGKNSGVATRLQTMFPNLLVWHCSNHRLELAVSDCVNEVSGINHFKIFIDKLYSLYHQSPKNQNELKMAAASLEAQILRIGRILSVRWVASSKRTINAVLHNYQALCKHFETASKDLTRDTKERAKYNGLLNIMTDVQFLKNTHAMSDALDEMGDLSELLQRRNITLVEADKAIRTTIRVFDSMATKPGPKLDQVLCSISEKKYKGIQLHDGKVVPINTAQLYTSLANNMRNRMITTSSSHGARDAKHQIENENIYNNLLACVKVLEPKNWPKSNDGEVEIQYGDKEIRRLCSQFHLNDAQIIRGFRSYKMSGGKEEIPDDLKPLLNIIASVPISTSECERNFSSVNEIVTPLRSSLSVETTAALLFINCVGPPLRQFSPKKYVRSWLAKGN